MGEKNREKLISPSYISLGEASGHCRYSQEYLSLRARQGKLKAVKIGRNWVTTKEWLDEYATKATGEVKEVREKKTESREQKTILPKSAPEPPENLPIGQFSKEIQDLFAQDFTPRPKLRFSLLFSFVLVILASGIFLNRAPFQDAFLELSAKVDSIGSVGETVIERAVSAIIKSYLP